MLRFESRFERWHPTEARSWKAGSAGTGAGVLYDLGTHLIDQAVQLLGPVEGVYGEVRTRREGSGADDLTFVALQHQGGAVFHLWMSAVAPSWARACGCWGRGPGSPRSGWTRSVSASAPVRARVVAASGRSTPGTAWPSSS